VGKNRLRGEAAALTLAARQSALARRREGFDQKRPHRGRCVPGAAQ
jgi:hypothetical protein